MSEHQHGYMPRKDGDLLDWVDNIVNQCEENQSEWNLETMLVGLVKLAAANARAAYNANRDPGTKNHLTATAKQAAFLELTNQARLLVSNIRGSSSVPESALAAMNIRPRHPGAHQPKEPPTEAPALTVLAGDHHDLTAYVATLQHGHPTEYLSDQSYHGFVLEYRFEEEEKYTRVYSSKLHYTLLFDEGDVGKFIYSRAAWINGRFQLGPWSEVEKDLVN
jgi:hypothetical protein